MFSMAIRVAPVILIYCQPYLFIEINMLSMSEMFWDVGYSIQYYTNPNTRLNFVNSLLTNFYIHTLL